MKLRLFSRADCPLCEDAEEQLLSFGVKYEYVDIDTSEELMKKYHTLVPVLQNSKNESLNWPFDEAKLLEFIDED